MQEEGDKDVVIPFFCQWFFFGKGYCRGVRPLGSRVTLKALKVGNAGGGYSIPA